jgi:hypothetical protein
VLAFLQLYTNQEHFLLLNRDNTIEESTQILYENLFAKINYDELRLLDARLLMPELLQVMMPDEKSSKDQESNKFLKEA